ncbi:hypothetical protein D3C85_1046030 [compost metagenome]
MAHHREAARLAGTVPETQVFVVQRQPQCLDQPGELLRSDARARLVEQLGADPQLLQQAGIVEATPLRTTEHGAGEMTGDGAFAHNRQIRALSDGW